MGWLELELELRGGGGYLAMATTRTRKPPPTHTHTPTRTLVPSSQRLTTPSWRAAANTVPPLDQHILRMALSRVCRPITTIRCASRSTVLTRPVSSPVMMRIFSYRKGSVGVMGYERGC